MRGMAVSIACASAVVMLPRLLSPQLGLLDDGVTVLAGEAMEADWRAVFELTRGTGRFMPAYWVFYGARHTVFGVNPFLLFLVNWLVLFVSAACLARFVSISIGRTRPAVLAGLLFVASGPVIENFYTLGKSEVPQTLLLAASLSILAALVRADGPAKSQALWAGALFGSVLAAFLTKETSFVLIPIGGGWLLLERLRPRAEMDAASTRGHRVYFLSTLIAAGVFLSLRWYLEMPSFTAGSYSRAYRLDTASVATSLGRWVLFGSRDFLYLLPLAAGAVVWLRAGGKATQRLLLRMGLWTGGWACVFLPWPSLLEYHMLPFSLGACVAGGLLLDGLIGSCVGSGTSSPRGRRFACMALVTTALLLAASVVSSISNARVQLAVDAANGKLLGFLATLPPGATLYVNLPGSNEYVYEIDVHLRELWRRPDIAVNYLPGNPDPTVLTPQSYLVTPRMRNQPVPSVRLAFSEGDARQWQTEVDQSFGHATTLIADISQRVRLLDVDVRLLACQAVGRAADTALCAASREWVDNRELLYGWSVYQGR